MEEIIYTKNTIQTQKFFDFEYDILGGQVVEARHNGKVIDPCIGQSLFLIDQKYQNNKRHHKLDKKALNNLKKCYTEQMNIWSEKNKHLREHIQKTETKLVEYKNTILAFGKLASSSGLSK